MEVPPKQHVQQHEAKRRHRPNDMPTHPTTHQEHNKPRPTFHSACMPSFSCVGWLPLALRSGPPPPPPHKPSSGVGPRLRSRISLPTAPLETTPLIHPPKSRPGAASGATKDHTAPHPTPSHQHRHPSRSSGLAVSVGARRLRRRDNRTRPRASPLPQKRVTPPPWCPLRNIPTHLSTPSLHPTHPSTPGTRPQASSIHSGLVLDYRSYRRGSAPFQ